MDKKSKDLKLERTDSPQDSNESEGPSVDKSEITEAEATSGDIGEERIENREASVGESEKTEDQGAFIDKIEETKNESVLFEKAETVEKHSAPIENVEISSETTTMEKVTDEIQVVEKLSNLEIEKQEKVEDHDPEVSATEEES